MVAYPLRLHGLGGHKRKARQPFLASFLKIAMRFQRSGMGRQLLHLVAMDQSLALRTLQCSRRKLPPAPRTLLLHHFRTIWGHQSAACLLAASSHIASACEASQACGASDYSNSALMVYSPADMSQLT